MATKGKVKPGLGKAGLIGGGTGAVGGAIGGRQIADNCMRSWNAKHGRNFITDQMSLEMEDQLLDELRQSAIRQGANQGRMPGTSGLSSVSSALGLGKK
jgi:hypothetical protein